MGRLMAAERERRPIRRHATRRSSIASLLVVLAWLAAAVPALAATATFGQPTISAKFGVGIDFRQPVTITGQVRRVELLITYPDAPGPEVRVIAGGPGTATLQYSLEAAKGGLLPNTTLSARWRVVGDDGGILLGPEATIRYDDTRFAWQTRQAGIVRVHWYDGSPEFGSRALDVGTKAIDRASRLLGVSETQAVDFYVYASQAAFYDALGPGTRENVGGQANSEIRTLFALITPGDITQPWVETVITHELTHLVFDTAVSNPYHFPPRWLNEGLAVYLSQGYGAGDRASVEGAASNGALMPLGALAFQFPTTRDRFALAYAESVAAVDYLVRAHGEAALVSLVRSYAGGVTDDEAFRTALGQDLSGFDAAWRASLRARDPVAYGPQPAPAGPLPAGWTAGADGSAGPVAPGADGGSAADSLRALGAVAAIVVVAVGLILLSSRRRSGAAADRSGVPPASPPDAAS
jgi:hypothetical protein